MGCRSVIAIICLNPVQSTPGAVHPAGMYDVHSLPEDHLTSPHSLAHIICTDFGISCHCFIAPHASAKGSPTLHDLLESHCTTHHCKTHTHQNQMSQMLQLVCATLHGLFSPGHQPDHLLSLQGLRTLVLGTKVLSEEVWADWDSRYQDAAAQLDNRDEALAALAVEIEADLEFVGVTAIEDKLQEGVPAAIQSLLDAGMKVSACCRLTGSGARVPAVALCCEFQLICWSIEFVRSRVGSWQQSQEGLGQSEAARVLGVAGSCICMYLGRLCSPVPRHLIVTTALFTVLSQAFHKLKTKHSM